MVYQLVQAAYPSPGQESKRDPVDIKPGQLVQAVDTCAPIARNSDGLHEFITHDFLVTGSRGLMPIEMPKRFIEDALLSDP